MVTVITTEKGKYVEFSLKLKQKCRVAVAGTFNHWNPEELWMSKAEGEECYRCKVELVPGIYEYCFILDGARFMDPENQRFVANEFGTMNSILEIQ